MANLSPSPVSGTVGPIPPDGTRSSKAAPCSPPPPGSHSRPYAGPTGRGNRHAWLDPSLANASALPRQFDADRMAATALDPYVNSIAHDDPTCLPPRGEAQDSQFDLGF
ncbi:MAG: hypothetical protein J6386_19910 [Candidatus Synoicihabitans palmerolidicus]|nr:hypothetical protein [Candidatus Synoicihabitans palmerolidicus]